MSLDAEASDGAARSVATAPEGWRSRVPGWLEVVALIAGAFFIAFVIKTFLVQAFYIPSGSMENTLQVGDRVLVNKLVYHFRPIARGDVIVFDGSGIFTPESSSAAATGPIAVIGRGLGALIGVAPPDERDFIKRVIGVAGDHVVCCDAQGQITVNGTALDEDAYLYPGNPPSRTPFNVEVPPGRLWVMGDHRSASADSRAHLGDPGGGFVPVDRVVGRAFAVVWPLSDARILEIPSTFEQPSLTQSNGGS